MLTFFFGVYAFKAFYYAREVICQKQVGGLLTYLHLFIFEAKSALDHQYKIA